ncbi:MAG TPA: amidase family protein, partial [Ktedonobacterales bacterium]
MANDTAPFAQLEAATIAQLQEQMSAGQLSARRLVEMCLARIDSLDRNGPALRSIIETNPDALDQAGALDRERAERGPRGPLHGIPLLLKDNIDTADRMATTAGSLALLGSRVARDATVAERLRAAGALFLGKANMSEWANFRSSHSSSGWSARGGQALNPYSLERSPSGSSSGSATATAAALCVAALGTETDGSILSPGGANGLVGIKPTVGLTSRAGVVPIAHTQDTIGVFARTVADTAAVLAVMAGPDPRDPATDAAPNRVPDYISALDESALRGARIGVAREVYFGFSEKATHVVEMALNTLRAQGAFLVDPANIPTARQMRASDCESTVLLYEFKADLDAYLATLLDAPVRTLADIIAFNESHAEQELPYFGQDT